MSAKIDWNKLGFDYIKTNANIRCRFDGRKWSPLTVTDDEYIHMHMATMGLHYGIMAFEGLKAFRGVDGKVRLFRPADNARRFQSSAYKLCLEPMPTDVFVDACVDLVRRNIDFVPPYESGASLYVRPLMYGSQIAIGVHRCPEVDIIFFASPVGPYFKGGMHLIKVVIDRMQDRAAPRGTGDIKAGGNYASSLLSGEKAHEMGYDNVMYLDAAQHRFIEECGAANFFGIKNNTYVTPASPSILPSVTNDSLRTLAHDMGLNVEQRPVTVEELKTFDEAGACGTAAVISPIGSIYDIDTQEYIDYGKQVGPVCMSLYNALRDIQYGRAEDKHSWCVIVE